MRLRTTRWLLCTWLVLYPAGAGAFDSAGFVLSGNKCYTQPAYVPACGTPANDAFTDQNCYPIQYPVPSADTCDTADAITAQQFNYVTKTFHLATANNLGDTTDTGGSPQSLLICPHPSPSLPPDDLQELNGCWTPDWSAGPVSTAGWVNLRRAWSGAPSGTWADFLTPEHMLITQQAAMIAGFPTPLGNTGTSTNPLFNSLFFVRYPVQDRYLASPLSTTPPTYVVGQSYQPVSFANIGAHASRGIYLAELAQMPDLSLSVWDWAAGNEQCPIANLDQANGLNAFSSGGSTLYDVNNCHDFTKMLGPLNVAHFKPGSHAYYSWYHALALSRMSECTNLATLVTPLDQGNLQGTTPAVTYDTEAHECEREAFVFEMFAQHFLQDNWSTGHMWAGWGSPDLAAFPTSPPLLQWLILSQLSGIPGQPSAIPGPLQWPAMFPHENVPARQVITAAVVAALRGTIHGTKAVSAGISLPPSLGLGPAVGSVSFLSEDPLCGPNYPDLLGALQSTDYQTWPDARTSWSLQGGTTALPLGPNGVSAGAGDYYWNPPASFGKVSILADDLQQHYQPQRDHLLACSAKSLRDVYDQGPGVHGPLNDLSKVDGYTIDSIDPNGPDCWNNWATNDSMEGALAPLFYSRQWPGLPGNAALQQLFQSLSPVFNTIVSYMAVKSKFGTTLAANQYDPNWLQALARLLSGQAILDNVALEATMFASALTDSQGTGIAQMGSPVATPGITMLGVPSWNPPASTTPPAYYADQATPRGSNFPTDAIMGHMFWRSHMREGCTENDATTIAGLRARCMQGALNGGDPEACTACVEAAEPQIPTCAPMQVIDSIETGELGPSKCEALTGGLPNTNLPLEWFDASFAQNEPCPSPAANPACTGNANARWVMTGPTLVPQCIPPQLEAIEYCTGTEGSTDPSAFGQMYEGGALLADPTDHVVLNPIGSPQVTNSACDSYAAGQNQPPQPYQLSDTIFQVALLHSEGVGVTPETIITAYQLERKETDKQPLQLPECTMQVAFGSNAPFADAPPPVPDGPYTAPAVSDAQSMLYYTPYIGAPFERGLGMCGTTQRFSYWDRSCADVLENFPQLGVPLDTGEGLQVGRTTYGYGYQDFTFTGQFGEQQSRCALVEPRSDSPQRSPFNHVCNSQGFVCNSGGLCVWDQGNGLNVNYLLSW